MLPAPPPSGSKGNACVAPSRSPPCACSSLARSWRRPLPRRAAAQPRSRSPRRPPILPRATPRSRPPRRRPGRAAPPPYPRTAPPPPPSASQTDPEEFRRQVMEEVRRELQKAKDEVKQQTAWIEQDSAARVQDSEAVESLRQRVNLFQPHGYLRLRGEFFNNLDLGRGPDQTGHTLFPGPFIGTGGNHSQSDANLRFRFEPTFEVSEDLSVYVQMDLLD